MTIILVGFSVLYMQNKSSENELYFDICYGDNVETCTGEREFTLMLGSPNDTVQTLNPALRPQFDVNYVIMQRKLDSIVYRMPVLVRSSILRPHCSYVGLNKVLNCTYGSHGTFDGFAVNVFPRKIASIYDLERALDNTTDHGLKGRYTLQLGQAYERAGKLTTAIERYQARVDLEGWRQETFYAQYRMGVCQLALNMTENAKVDFLKAFAIDSYRKEPLYYMARIARVEKNYPLCLIYAGAGLQIGVPWADALFVESDVYRWKLEEEYALCQYFTGRRESAHYHWNRLLEMSDVPESSKIQIKKNMEF